MKLLVAVLTSIFFIFLLFTVNSVTKNSVRADPANVTALKVAVQEPTPPVWDPRHEGVKDIDEGRSEVAAPDRKPLDIVRHERFTPEEFARYVKTTVVPKLKAPGQWRPSFIVLHHTGVPSIRQRPEGFSADNMEGLAYYYGVAQGWRSGPHVFVDQNGIWIFTDLALRGTHSPSWNGVAWGIEQLGNFITENYQEGAGSKVRDNAIAAIAILSVAADLDPQRLRFHKEDRRTTHKDCPGDTCKKPEVLTKVKSEIENWRRKWDSL